MDALIIRLAFIMILVILLGGVGIYNELKRKEAEKKCIKLEEQVKYLEKEKEMIIKMYEDKLKNK